jgi:hypothetical protein
MTQQLNDLEKDIFARKQKFDRWNQAFSDEMMKVWFDAYLDRPIEKEVTNER